jgi:GNAT superfamily N-acetyltransferase
LHQSSAEEGVAVSDDTIQIRPSRPGDADAILAFIRAMGFTPRDRVTWDALGMSAAIAMRGDEIVGAIPIEMRPVKISPDLTVQWAHQTCVAVHPDLRGGGLGSRLQTLLRSTLPMGTQMMGVYREDPGSPAYRWYVNNGFRMAMTVVSWTMEISPSTATSSPVPSPPYSGERARVRGSGPAGSEATHESDRPLTLTLSPDYRGEGTRLAQAWTRTRNNGCYVDQSQRPLLKWLDVHPYRSRYRFEIVESEAGYAVVGIGALHSETPRADLLDFVADESGAEALLDLCIARASELRASPLRWALSKHDPLTTLAKNRGMVAGWKFDLLIQEMVPGLHVDTSSWRYASIDFA